MRFLSRRNARRGQGMTEYVIIVALIAIATIGIVTIFGDQVRSLFRSSAERLANKPSTPQDMTQGAGGQVQKNLGNFSN